MKFVLLLILLSFPWCDSRGEGHHIQSERTLNMSTAPGRFQGRVLKDYLNLKDAGTADEFADFAAHNPHHAEGEELHSHGHHHIGHGHGIEVHDDEHVFYFFYDIESRKKDLKTRILELSGLFLVLLVIRFWVREVKV
jgi:hypothetical protein